MKKLLLLILIFAISTASSEENYEDALKSNFINNSGRDFWFTVPPAYLIGGKGNYVKIFVFSAEETEVTVSVPGLEYEEIKVVPKNNVAVFNLSPDTAQVKEFDHNEGPLEAEIHRGKGINVNSTNPITVYCVVHYNHTSDGFLCLPTNALGNSYVASPYSSRPIGSPDQSLPNLVGVTAVQDNTKLKFTLGGNANTEVPLGEGEYLLPGQSKIYKMDRGDVIVFSNRSGPETLTGSLVEADKNISVVSSHYCADIPMNNHWCDYNGEMDLPIHTWGRNFHIPMVNNKKYSGILRIIAKDDSTTVYRDGVEIGFIKTGMGGLENDAWFETRVLPYQPNNTGVALYSSDKPIYVMFYNQGVQEDGAGYDPIEPFSMVISPVEQYQNELNLSAPLFSESYHKFELNYMNLIYPINSKQNDSIDIQIGKWENDKFVYSPLEVSATYSEYVLPSELDIQFPSGLDSLQYVHTIIEMEEGIQKIKSNKPIMAYLYGGHPYDTYDSYGYPASIGLLDLSLTDSIPPTLDWAIDYCLGKVESATASDMPNDSTGSYLHDIRLIPEATYNFGSLTFSSAKATNKNIIPSNTNLITWSLSVLDKDKDAQAKVLCIDKAGNKTIETINYYLSDYTIKYNNYEDLSSLFLGSIDTEEKITSVFKILNNSKYNELVIVNTELLNENEFKIVKKPKSPIPSLDSTFLEIEFVSSEKGEYANKLSLNFACNLKYELDIRTSVLAPLISVDDIEFVDKFDISNPNEKPMIKQLNIVAACSSEIGSDLVITNIDDMQLPKEFSHNLPDSLTLKAGAASFEHYNFNISFYPSKIGKYEGKIFFEAENGGCDSVCIVSAEAISNKGVDEQNSNVQIHPNPVKDELNINFIDKTILLYDVQLLDMTGNVLYSVSANSGLSINMNRYSAGLYYILIKDKSGKLLRKEKIIKQ